MRLPLRIQLYVPFAAISVVAVAIVAITTAFLAARARQRESLQRLDSVIETLRTAQFPFTSVVLEQMHGLSGAEFLVENQDGTVTASTLPDSEAPRSLRERDLERETSLTTRSRVRLDDVEYFAARVPLETGPTRGSLFVLLPVSAWRQMSFEAAAPPLIAGAATSAAALVIAGWLASRFTRRLRAIRQSVSRIAQGFDEPLSTHGPDDELTDLAGAVNSMSDQLRQHERTIRQTERVRLTAQLSSGLAHQLRNASSGARLAIQLVRRRYPDMADRELEVAMTQLEVIEDHLKRLLSVAPDPQKSHEPGALRELFRSVEELGLPVCRHAGVRLDFEVEGLADDVIPDFAGIRSAVLNLVMNGSEAAGRGGFVRVRAERRGRAVQITVSDSGSGPEATMIDRIFEPFATSKPEGIGLGLSFVKRTAESAGGTVTWHREADVTSFVLEVPVVHIAGEAPAPSAS